MRVVQFRREHRRHVAVVDGGQLRLVDAESVLELAEAALRQERGLAGLCAERVTHESISYDEAEAVCRFLPCVDHPVEPARCLVSGTGLTHESSAMNRNAMHAGAAEMTDSLRMYRWGVEGGKPAEGLAGVAPEWFYKGPGTVLRGHLEALTTPWHAEDGGEEPEVAGVYLIDGEGQPRRLGMAQGNEFSDHVHERKNYLYLAESKLRTCALGPELVLDASFDDVAGEAAVWRGGSAIWRKAIRTGAAAMSHSLENIEHHHFKHAAHRRTGDVHVHFLGTGAFSFGDGVRLEDGDVMEVRYDGFGRALRNPVSVEKPERALVRARKL